MKESLKAAHFLKYDMFGLTEVKRLYKSIWDFTFWSKISFWVGGLNLIPGLCVWRMHVLPMLCGGPLGTQYSLTIQRDALLADWHFQIAMY